MSVVRYYGAKPDTYDHRDQRKVYSRAEIPSSRYHPKVNLSKYVVSVYDQGQLGSCTANALCGTYALDLQKQSETLRGTIYMHHDGPHVFLNLLQICIL